MLFAIGVYVVWTNDSMQSKTCSLGFMNEITNGDIDGAHAYSNGSSGSRKVIESLAPSVKALGIADEDNAEKKWNMVLPVLTYSKYKWHG
ncbi:MAG: hypothetical protein KatS3mg087_1856 [Patescibacteria group bacterium]|nr:MAG: hypothetical protein KatS3mg087_1856 [Patescibacteria group bacterium]